MYIIFGSNAAEEVGKVKLVLEVDTIRIMPQDVLAPSYCVLDEVVMDGSPFLINNIQVHQETIKQYRLQNWNYCINAIKDLRGCWGGELDEFYNSVLERAQQYAINPPGPDWHYALTRYATSN